MTFFLEDEPLFRTFIGRILQRPGVQLLAGGPRTVGDGPARRYYNSAFLLATDGGMLARYDKERLVPFAEYFPFASVDLLRREFGRVREFSPVATPTPIPTVVGAAGVVISTRRCSRSWWPPAFAPGRPTS